MKIKIKYIALGLFLIDAIFIIINIKYRDQTLSVVPVLNQTKFFFFLGTLSFIAYLILLKQKKSLQLAAIITITSLSIAMYNNLRLAKDNYDRIQCLKGISEYFQYFENDSCSKIEKKFKEDVINGTIKYFQDEYNFDLEFEERLRDKYNVELVGISCTRYSAMNCYNDLVKDHIKKLKER
ncbi:hypothetical protein [Olleya sp. HaHaR_3_96]|uniref:hypothetical protein n=1 Tax=Olleya sp. HaHaR_3_96 TaxID=2745560 RepID=UPI001C4E4DDE|nr:hypothetical protein [Olleya sp. HaHaR_3_96]QXP59704.1 hypothetical protein H0I26_17620 [Olleya sp. HaHaR_3_96]